MTEITFEQAVDHATQIMTFLDQYEDTKASYMATTHVEEALLWLKVVFSETAKRE